MKDLIFAAYSCSALAPCRKWASAFFDNYPTVLEIPGNGSVVFSQAGTIIGNDLQGWLERRGHDDPDRIAVVTFSAGWGFVHSLLATQARERIDTILLLDGLHTKERLEPWFEFGSRAARGGPQQPLLAMFHSQIVPPYVSAKAACQKVYSGAIARLETYSALSETPPDPLPTKVQFDRPRRIVTSYGSRIWTDEPLATWQGVGNLYRFEYAGNDAATHVYIAQHVQPLAWQMLADRWNSGGQINACE